jgi:transmembrane sensor
MKKPADWKLLARYLADECTDEEKESIQSWLLLNPENQEWIEPMKTVWQAPETIHKPSDIKKLWESVAEQTGIHAKPQEKELKQTSQFLSRIILWPARPRPVLARIAYSAAAFILIASLPVIIFKILPSMYRPEEMQVVQVKNTKQVRLTLEDGSRVVLDAGSTFRHPEKFRTNTREVDLEGEAYFEVAHHPDRPFIVHAGDAVIRVLGTKFNVRAWSFNHKVTVAVEEGSVSLNSEDSASPESIVLTKDQSSTWTPNGQITQPVSVNIEEHTGWMHNEMIFHDAPLGEVLHALERWYDLRFVLPDASVAEEHVTVHIQKTSVVDLLELIAALSGMEFDRQGNTVRFSR